MSENKKFAELNEEDLENVSGGEGEGEEESVCVRGISAPDADCLNANCGNCVAMRGMNSLGQKQYKCIHHSKSFYV